MPNLAEKQRLILDLLLDFPDGLTADELADGLGVTKTAAKEHVQKLVDLGYLAYTDVKGQVGRPKRRYQLTGSGHEVLPRQYSWLSNLLLEVMTENFGGADVSRVMKLMAEQVAQTVEGRLARFATTPKRYAEIAAIMSELGYRARLKQSDVRKNVVIEATNCVYHSVAKEHPELCQFDLALLERMGGAKVRLESCIARGGAVCRFCLRTGEKKGE